MKFKVCVVRLHEQLASPWLLRNNHLRIHISVSLLLGNISIKPELVKEIEMNKVLIGHSLIVYVILLVWIVKVIYSLIWRTVSSTVRTIMLLTKPRQ